ncbi:MAG: hypothetical protein FJZ67_04905, partial [Bacteroidetes bacterium]|nr:hypothetical protein [Bacteroidota bacterium]
NLLLFLLASCFVIAQPKLSFTESKSILILDDENQNENQVTLKATFTNEGTKKIGMLWTISGIKDKDWKLVKGTEKSDQITVEFNKVGVYSVSNTVTFSKKITLKDGTTEDEEDEISVEKENVITVTNNLDELTQIHADSSFIKLVKKASDYVVKPKYANDPTPHIFLAKGYYGMYRKDLKDVAIPDPLDEAVTSTATAIELDVNGIFNMTIHKIWLNKFQNEIASINVLFNLEEENNYPLFYQGDNAERKTEINDQMLEGIEQYISITKNPLAGKLLEAAIRFNMKDVKTATAIWKEETKNLLALRSLDNYTETDLKVLKTGIILSAQMLQKKDNNSTEACKMLTKANEWFGKQKDFYSYYEKEMNSCQPK